MEKRNNRPFENDKLERKNIAEQFKNILLNTDLNVFSLVAPWGCGKTYFIKNLIQIMDDDSINILYNAWESDFYDSPLIPLLVELLNKLENNYEKTDIEEDIKTVKEVVKNICSKASFQIGLNFGVANCSVNFDPSKKMIESEYLELKNLINEFRNKLKSVQEKLNKKIIIFIDELDRCNPMYTIKTLEVIKHFFGIENIIFVLAIDKSQIENSVRTIFGVNQGTENGYLRKFIDVEFQLLEPHPQTFINFQLTKIWDKINYFISKNKYYRSSLQIRKTNFGFERGINYSEEQNYIAEFIFQISSVLNFSLRDIEKYFMRFILVLDSLKEKDVLLIEPCILFNALAMQDIKYVEEYLNQKPEKENHILIIKKINSEFLKCYPPTFFKNFSIHVQNIPANMGEQEYNIYMLHDFFSNSCNLNTLQQEKYLQDYTKKIQYINNYFN